LLFDHLGLGLLSFEKLLLLLISTSAEKRNEPVPLYPLLKSPNEAKLNLSPASLIWT
jgi:hypothetical protein